MELNHVTLIFSVTLKGNVPDPYLLFSARGAFEESFREAVGCRRGECRGCSTSGCAFAATFAQELSRDPEGVRRHQKPPLPFVFDMPVLPPLPNKEKRVECALSLFGSAIQHFDSYLAAATLLFARLPAQVTGVELLCPGGTRTLLPTGAAGKGSPLPLLSSADPIAAGPLAADRVKVEFVTPLRLLSDGKVLKEVSFSHFARALQRRVSAMAYYYGGVELPLDYRALASASERIACAAGRCRSVQWGKHAGVVGELTFCGDLVDFHPLLLFGRAMHLGKGASFGFGEFRLS